MAENTGERPIDSVPGVSDARLLGAGGFGQVFVAREEKLHREVAVKVLSRPQDNTSLRQFEREMAALGTLSQHPNIVTLLRAGVTPDGYPFLVMEYASGGSLDQHLKDSGPFEWERAFDIGAEVCKALTEADGSGVTHQDVKPPNIFLSAYDVPLLGDFGVARLAGATATLNQSVTATFSHASPEQVEGLDLDGRTDIYSLGSTLYQLIAGHAAFSGPDDSPSFQSLLARLATAAVPRNPALPEQAYQVLARAMAKNPDDRYQTAAGFAQALRAAVDQPPQVPLPAVPASPPAPVSLPAPVPPAPPVRFEAPSPAQPPAPPVRFEAPSQPVSPQPAPPQPGPPQPGPPQPVPPQPGAGTGAPNRTGLVVGAVVAVIALLAAGLWVSGVGRNGDDQVVDGLRSGDDSRSAGSAIEPTAEPTVAPATRPTPRPGPDDAASPAPTPTPESAPAPTAAVDPAPELPAGVIPASVEEWERLWAAQRATIVAGIRANGYGVTNGVLSGPGGFLVDLGDCPSGWSDTEGIDNGVITLAETTAQSGQLAAYGNIGVGMGAYFDYVNANGGIGPQALQIELVSRDDAYNATLTIELVEELVAGDQPFLITTLGTPNTFAVRDILNADCIPHPLVATAHPAWGDPEGRPWTSGLQMSFTTEAHMWGAWIEDNIDGDTIRVAALVMDNDFGLAYEQAFERVAEASGRIEVSFVRHDPVTTNLTNEITTLAAEDPDVYISMTAGAPCLLAIEEAARAGLTTSAQALFTSSVCENISAYVEPAGGSADNWYVMGGGFKNTASQQHADDAYIQWMKGVIADAGLDPSISLYTTGFAQFGWAHVQALQIAAELDGGVTRSNYLLAVRSLDMTHPLLLPGISFSVDGVHDSFLVEGSDIRQFDAASQTWVPRGVIDLNGQTANCSWAAGRGC